MSILYFYQKHLGPDLHNSCDLKKKKKKKKILEANKLNGDNSIIGNKFL